MSNVDEVKLAVQQVKLVSTGKHDSMYSTLQKVLLKSNTNILTDHNSKIFNFLEQIYWYRGKL